MLLIGLLALAGCRSGHAGSADRPVDPAFTRLDSAIDTVSTSRSALLAAVDAVQSAATRLDMTDELCAAGKGRPARASFTAGVPLLRAARRATTTLGALVLSASQALDGLREAGRSSVVRQGERSALDAVVRDGRAEAVALEGFRSSLTGVWPAYDLLNADEDVWSTRAVSGWYRTSQESAGAYLVLVGPRRPALDTARARLAAAVAALEGPLHRQSATLAAADKALQRLRAG